jgi:hypothetical protein
MGRWADGEKVSTRIQKLPINLPYPAITPSPSVAPHSHLRSAPHPLFSKGTVPLIPGYLMSVSSLEKDSIVQVVHRQTAVKAKQKAAPRRNQQSTVRMSQNHQGMFLTA